MITCNTPPVLFPHILCVFQLLYFCEMFTVRCRQCVHVLVFLTSVCVSCVVELLTCQQECQKGVFTLIICTVSGKRAALGQPVVAHDGRLTCELLHLPFFVCNLCGQLACSPLCEYPVSWTKQTMVRQACDILHGSCIKSDQKKGESL